MGRGRKCQYADTPMAKCALNQMYREKMGDKLLEKVPCPFCQKPISKTNKSKHFKVCKGKDTPPETPTPSLSAPTFPTQTDELSDNIYTDSEDSEDEESEKTEEEEEEQIESPEMTPEERDLRFSQ